ncbi:MAG TPA: twin-arginine translocase TatA/TatE family subunit [Candidatus Acidoferrales bacterium]|nr:twin-arginine translocase TatA/TatE family subunit [Candidatus Acidoferrales bacterium]
MLSGVSIWQLLILLVIVVLVFGTRRLGSMGGDIGAAIRNFRSALSDEDDGKGGKAAENLPPSTAAGSPASEKTREDTHAG